MVVRAFERNIRNSFIHIPVEMKMGDQMGLEEAELLRLRELFTYPESTSLNAPAPIPPRYAVVTLIASQQLYSRDFYYLNARSTLRSLIHDPVVKIRREDVDVVALIMNSVSAEAEESLIQDGIKVYRISKFNIPAFLASRGDVRWASCFTKLLMWRMVKYARILYLDADTSVFRPLDEIFSWAEMFPEGVLDEYDLSQSNLYETPYRLPLANAKSTVKTPLNKFGFNQNVHFLAAVQEELHFNAGVMLLTPNMMVYNDLISLVPHFDQYNVDLLEQGLLNKFFSGELRIKPLPRQLNCGLDLIDPLHGMGLQCWIMHAKLWELFEGGQSWYSWWENVRYRWNWNPLGKTELSEL